MLTNEFLKQNNRPMLGLYMQSEDPYMIELAKIAGFDFVRIDMEHVLYDSSELRHMIRTANLIDLPVQVRVADLTDITKLLDFGADGIVVPDVDSVERAKQAIDLTKYYPLGQRGMYPGARCMTWRGEEDTLPQYVSKANRNVTLTIQLENVHVLKHVDEILSLDGIDMVATGKADISQSMGIPGQTDDARVIDFETAVISKAIQYGKQPVVVARGKRLQELMNMGVMWFMVGMEYDIIKNAFERHIVELKQLCGLDE